MRILSTLPPRPSISKRHGTHPAIRLDRTWACSTLPVERLAGRAPPRASRRAPVRVWSPPSSWSPEWSSRVSSDCRHCSPLIVSPSMSGRCRCATGRRPGARSAAVIIRVRADLEVAADLSARVRKASSNSRPRGYHGDVHLDVFSQPQGRRADRTRPETDDEESRAVVAHHRPSGRLWW